LERTRVRFLPKREGKGEKKEKKRKLKFSKKRKNYWITLGERRGGRMCLFLIIL